MDFQSFFDTYSGPVFAAVFFLLMGYIFYWIIVILPRRVKEVYAQLAKKGYCQIDPSDSSLQKFLITRAPIYPIDPLTGEILPDWECSNVAVLDEKTKKRTIINAQRGQVDRPGTSENTTARNTTILVDDISLPFNTELHLVPSKNTPRIRWEKRYGLKKIISGLDSDLTMNYEVEFKKLWVADNYGSKIGVIRI